MMLNLFSDNWRFILSILLALIVGFSIQLPVLRMALLKNFVDKPNHRSSHSGSIPNIGGIVVFVAFFSSFLIFSKFSKNHEFQYIILGACIIFMIGIYDDLLKISPKKKLKGELLGILVVLIGGGFYLDNLHDFLGIHEIIPWVGVPLTVLCFIGLINAINLIDGIDGLCAGIVFMDSLFFCMWFYHWQQIEYALLCGVLAASIFPFFITNLYGKRSKMFMGDSGALMVGFLLGVFAIKFCHLEMYSNQYWFVGSLPGIVFSLFAVPILDTLRLFVSRILRGYSPFAPDRTHLHHKLLILYGGVHSKATFTILFLNLIFIGIGTLGKNYSTEWLVGIDVLIFLMIWGIVEFLVKWKEETL